MSRTFRKNRRWFSKVHGEYYSAFSHNPSMKFPLPLKNMEELPGCDTKYYAASRGSYKYSRHIVRVGDGDNYGKGVGKELKQTLNRMDRSRAKHALTRAMKDWTFNYEVMENLVPAFNPWDWD